VLKIGLQSARFAVKPGLLGGKTALFHKKCFHDPSQDEAGRRFRRRPESFHLVAGTQYYQMKSDAYAVVCPLRKGMP